MLYRNLLVVGGSSEIGAAIIRCAESNSYKVFSTQRSVDSSGLLMDVTSDESVKSAIDQAIAISGTIDAVVYAPALSIDGLIHTLSDEAWSKTFDVNLFGAARVVRHLLPHFIKARKGVFLFVSSTAAVRGATGAAPYSCSKAALNALALNIAHDYGRFNIRAYTVMPGYVDGGMLAHLPDEKKVVLAREASLKRLATPDEVAHFCVATLDSTYLTGTALALDGGLTS
ncbi:MULTISPECIES: SDR family oxidoreductase [unclassified Pseudomonas]|uniref:SDR family NAD(P)-dependent oxidoreductase n=1 Tax=unclassified Pseudomonas TaxID=196821 RepID=UPI001D1440A3|nr:MULTISPECIES: SDR family oxidoreductase [unclassified Pseudomonas]